MFTSHASNDDDDDVGVNNDAKNVVSKPIMDSYVREEAKAEMVKKEPKFLAASNDTEDVTAIVSVDVKVVTPPGNLLLLFSISLSYDILQSTWRSGADNRSCVI